MKGVAAFIKDQANGSVVLVLNDVEAVSSSEEPNWKHVSLFASSSYNADSLKNLSLSKEQFADIGENLVIRLLALGGHLK